MLQWNKAPPREHHNGAQVPAIRVAVCVAGFRVVVIGVVMLAGASIAPCRRARVRAAAAGTICTAGWRILRVGVAAVAVGVLPPWLGVMRAVGVCGVGVPAGPGLVTALCPSASSCASR